MSAHQFTDDASALPRRVADRSVAVGAAVSLTVHVMVVLAFLGAAAGQGGRTTHEVEGLEGAAMNVVLVTPPAVRTGKAAQDGAASPARGGSPPAAAPVRPAPVPEPSSLGEVGGARSPGEAEGASGRSEPAALQVAAADPAAGIEYGRRLREHIALYRRTAAFDDGDHSGTVRLQFSIDRSGAVLSVTVLGSSGAGELDHEAVATVWRAQPMPSVPQELPVPMSVTFPMKFGITGKAPG